MCYTRSMRVTDHLCGPGTWGLHDPSPLRPSQVFHGHSVYVRTGPPLDAYIGPVERAERVIEERKGPSVQPT